MLILNLVRRTSTAISAGARFLRATCPLQNLHVSACTEPVLSAADERGARRDGFAGKVHEIPAHANCVAGAWK